MLMLLVVVMGTVGQDPSPYRPHKAASRGHQRYPYFSCLCLSRRSRLSLLFADLGFFVFLLLRLLLLLLVVLLLLLVLVVVVMAVLVRCCC